MATASLPIAHQRAKPRRDARELFSRPVLVKLAALAVAHVVLAFAMRETSLIATGHAIACGLGGVAYALTTKKLARVAYVAAYIAGCEVLWRMCRADIFWEFGKYAVVAVLGAALLRISWKRNRALAVAYIGLLLPSVLLTLNGAASLDKSRQLISFNLAGPLALTVAVLYFSNVRATVTEYLTTLVALIAPILSIATIVLVRTTSVAQLEFVNAANFSTSGGFGPNQVSAMLGVCMMGLLLVVMTQRDAPWLVRLPCFAIAAIAGAESALTFARGGLLLAVAGLASATFVLMQGNARARVTVVIVAIFALLVGRFVIEPRLDEFTGGRLSQRYTNTKTSGRDTFVRSELETFVDHPILGVGPGMAMIQREERGEFFGASHTEYTRTLAEHGILGLFAIGCLVLLSLRCVLTTKERIARAMTVALLTWALLFWLVYGTRIVAPSFLFGLAFFRRPPPAPPS